MVEHNNHNAKVFFSRNSKVYFFAKNSKVYLSTLIYIYIKHCNVVNNEAQARGAMIRELVLHKCDESHLLNSDERKLLLEFLCTM